MPAPACSVTVLPAHITTPNGSAVDQATESVHEMMAGTVCQQDDIEHPQDVIAVHGRVFA
jgi:hypothetical protein